MQKYSDVVLDRAGNAIARALVYVYNAGSGTLATIYSDNSSTAQSNPMQSDSDGAFAFYAANGRYDVKTVHGDHTKWDYDKLLDDPNGSLAIWIASGDTPTQTSATTFTVSSDRTSFYTVGRSIKVTDTGTFYGIITASSYTVPNTTITVALFSGALSASLSSVSASIHDPEYQSVPCGSVGFTQSLSNSNARNQEEKTRETLSITDVLAFDGVTSEGAAFNTLISEAQGRHLLMPAGTALIGSTTLEIDQNRIQISGDATPGIGLTQDYGSIINYTGTGTGLQIGISPGGADFIHGVELKNLRLQVAPTTAVAMDVWMSQFSRYENINIVGNNSSGRIGLRVRGGTHAEYKFIDVMGHDGGVVPANYLGYGLRIENGYSNGPITTTTFYKGYFHYCYVGANNNADGFLTFDQTVFESNTIGFQNTGGVAPVEFRSCWFEANLNSDIYFGNNTVTRIKNTEFNSYTRQNFFTGDTPKLIVLEGCRFSSSHASPTLFASGNNLAGVTIIIGKGCTFPANMTIGGTGIDRRNVKFIDMPISVYRFVQTGVAANTTYNTVPFLGASGANDAYVHEKGYILATHAYYSSTPSAGTWETALRKDGVAIAAFSSSANSGREATINSQYLANPISAGSHLQAKLVTSVGFAATGGTFILEAIVAHGEEGLP